MVAVGFVLVIIGVFVNRLFCDRYSEVKPMDWVVFFTLWPGLLLVISGIAVWLFRVMP